MEKICLVNQARSALKRVSKACSEFHNWVVQPSPEKI